MKPITLIALLCAAPAAARPSGPPPEAMAACSGAPADASCDFQSPHGLVEGTCRSMRGQLACVPDGPPPGGPPPEAFAACSGMAAAAACTVDAPHGRLTGQCHAAGQRMLCVPEGMPRPPAGGMPPRR